MINFFTKPWIAYGVFWTWNLILLGSIITIESTIHIFSSIFLNDTFGVLPYYIKFLAALMTLGPVFCMVLGATFFRGKPRKLLQFFFGVELPIGLLIFLRFFILRDIHGAGTHFFIVFVIAILSYSSELFFGLHKYKALRILQNVGHSLLIWIAIFLAAVLVVYTPPALVTMLQSITRVHDVDFLEVIFTLFAVLSLGILLVMPLVLLRLYPKAFVRNWKAADFGKLAIAIVLLINIGVYYNANYNQVQHYAFDQYEEFGDQTVKHSDVSKVKKGLLNAYLHSYRYVGSIETNNHVLAMYHETFHVAYENVQWIQDLQSFFMMPFLYDGKWRDDREKAEEIYASLFDEQIEKDNLDEICTAVASTFEFERAEANVLDINERKIHIEKQEISFQENGDVAEIELHEVYKNRTSMNEEVFYYFQLPAFAAVDGMWLSGDSIKRFEHRVAGRGAAQQVYREQVRRSLDPSLLELVGPDKYRLRIFPVLPTRSDVLFRTIGDGTEEKEDPEMHIWIKFQVLKDGNGNYPLPHLTEKRNVYWDDDTRFVLNGKEQTRAEEWLPSHLTSSSDTRKVARRCKIGNEWYEFEELGNLDQSPIDPPVIVIDNTYSMTKCKTEILVLLNDLVENGLVTERDNIYLVDTSARHLSLRGLIRALEDDAQIAFGSNENLALVRSAEKQIGNGQPLLFITDKGNYELASDSAKAFHPEMQVDVLHVPGFDAPIYQDAFVETITNSGGSFYKSVEHYVNSQKVKSVDSETLLCEDNVLFRAADSLGIESDPFLESIAAKLAIQYAKVPLDNNRHTKLLSLHALAQDYDVVTPYSSMIVLVNERQLRRLEEAEAEDDLFDREIEGSDAVTNSKGDMFEVSGVPEPEEWILLLLVISLIGLFHWRSRSGKSLI